MSVTLGSPPLARELPGSAGEFISAGRITPARAGTTLMRCRGVLPSADHPRSRGNYFAASGERLRHTGSPPLARELPKLNGYARNGVGITPARAGTTSSHRLQRTDCCGSPPLARELPQWETTYVRPNRITPARAGTTHNTATYISQIQDHPRSRGNYRKTVKPLGCKGGSPPLARELRFLNL